MSPLLGLVVKYLLTVLFTQGSEIEVSTSCVSYLYCMCSISAFLFFLSIFPKETKLKSLYWFFILHLCSVSACLSDKFQPNLRGFIDTELPQKITI